MYETERNLCFCLPTDDSISSRSKQVTAPQQDTLKFKATTCNRQQKLHELQKHWAFIHLLIKIHMTSINIVLGKKKKGKLEPFSFYKHAPLVFCVLHKVH